MVESETVRNILLARAGVYLIHQGMVSLSTVRAIEKSQMKNFRNLGHLIAWYDDQRRTRLNGYTYYCNLLGRQMGYLIARYRQRKRSSD